MIVFTFISGFISGFIVLQYQLVYTGRREDRTPKCHPVPDSAGRRENKHPTQSSNAAK